MPHHFEFYNANFIIIANSPVKCLGDSKFKDEYMTISKMNTKMWSSKWKTEMKDCGLKNKLKHENKFLKKREEKKRGENLPLS